MTEDKFSFLIQYNERQTLPEKRSIAIILLQRRQVCADRSRDLELRNQDHRITYATNESGRLSYDVRVISRLAVSTCQRICIKILC